VLKAFPYRAVKVQSESTDAFKLNGQHLKHFISRESTERKVLELIGPKAHSGVVKIKVDSTDTRSGYRVVFPQDRLNKSKLTNKIKLCYLSNLTCKHPRNLIKSSNFLAQELIKSDFFRWIISKQIIELSNPSFKVE